MILLGLAIPFAIRAQPGLGAGPVTEEDFKLPLQDLEELEGEVVWLQGALTKGDPTPYRNPIGPVAAYEQGLLDDGKELWTFLDNPKGRELRYNPELRGQRIIVKGWKYPQSKILEVYTWEDKSRHPVRMDEEYPEPERIPFDRERAERITSIKPVEAARVSEKLIDKTNWELGEGKVLSLDPTVSSASLVPTLEAEQVRNLLHMDKLAPATEERILPATKEMPPNPQEPVGAEKGVRAEGGGVAPSTSTPPSRKIQEPLPPLELKPKGQEGEPLVTPEEFDRALQRSLVE